MCVKEGKWFIDSVKAIQVVVDIKTDTRTSSSDCLLSALSTTSACNHKTSLKWFYPVSNKILSCFAEATDQNHKSCSGSIQKGENFDLQLHPKSKSLPLYRNKVLGHN